MEEDNSDPQTYKTEDEDKLTQSELEQSESTPEVSKAESDQKDQSVPQIERNDDPSCTLYVCRLSLKTREDDLRRLFENHGEVTDCHLVTNPLTGESRCFGFVTMGSEEDAARAKDALDGKEYQDASLKVETARRAKPYDPTPGEYKGPQYRSIKYNNSRPGHTRSHRGNSFRHSSRSRYDYPPPSHSRGDQYSRHSDDYYNSRYYDNRYPRQEEYHQSRYHSPPRYSRSDPYDTRYSRR
ncbi:RRM domain-containing protein [Cryptosporidium canis]|uniref:RRM domain-containing protein n=1 Tax=Cryptosporidium canis TaxID=195482 RepID=A0A9D5DHB5_9CRYT|nr:RRM domain-containing protein [Cryptosporidium canis]